jgi:flagellar capping protein FliD
METTRNQELQDSINQAHASIKKMTSEIGSTNSRIEKVEHKFDTMEAKFTTQFTALESAINQFLNRPKGPSSSNQTNDFYSS